MSHKKRTTNNLVALGSAAVVAVYAAGYVRSAEAAQRFSDESNERRRPAPDQDVSSPAGVVTAGATRDARTAAKLARNGAASVQGASGTSAADVAAPVDSSKQTVAVATTTRDAGATVIAGEHVVRKQLADSLAAAIASAKRAATVTTATPSIAIAPAGATKNSAPASSGMSVVTAQTVQPSNAANGVKPATAPSSVAAATPAVIPSTAAAPPAAITPPVNTQTSVTVDAAAALKSAAKPTLPPLPPGVKWRDGSYTGWGTSRHGDIQATVEVDEGKISYVAVTQCLTQYSCSFIEKLPQQVLDRQSPEVDSVSGATQSTNAFYYAIVQALSKAK